MYTCTCPFSFVLVTCKTSPITHDSYLIIKSTNRAFILQHYWSVFFFRIQKLFYLFTINIPYRHLVTRHSNTFNTKAIYLCFWHAPTYYSQAYS